MAVPASHRNTDMGKIPPTDDAILQKSISLKSHNLENGTAPKELQKHLFNILDKRGRLSRKILRIIFYEDRKKCCSLVHACEFNLLGCHNLIYLFSRAFNTFNVYECIITEKDK